jgi:hypothetical protein
MFSRIWNSGPHSVSRTAWVVGGVVRVYALSTLCNDALPRAVRISDPLGRHDSMPFELMTVLDDLLSQVPLALNAP